MQVRVQNKGKSVWKSRYDGDVSAPTEIEEIDVTIKLANRDTISPIGIIRDVEVLCGKIKIPYCFSCSWFPTR